MRMKTKNTENLDIKDPEFWNSMKVNLIKVTSSGRILVKDTITGSKMTFSANWTALQIAKAISNARAQWLK